MYCNLFFLFTFTLSLFSFTTTSHAFELDTVLDSGTYSYIQDFMGEADEDDAGTAVGMIGDINGDGIEDFAIGAPRSHTSSTPTSGTLYIYYGTNSGSWPSDSLADANVTITGINDQNAGAAFAGVGDVDGDGIDDLVVGGDDDSNVAFLVFGSTSFTSLDLTSVSHPTAVKIAGDFSFGSSAAAAGDVDNDGIPDFLVGSPASDLSSGGSGGFYLYLGRSISNWSSVSTDNDADLVIEGRNNDDHAGEALSHTGFGDFDGDGIDDIILGAADADNGGKIYIVYGIDSTAGESLATSPLNLMNADVTLKAENSGDQVGVSYAVIPDLNSDGKDEILVGASENDDGGSASGKVYLIYGEALSGESDIISVADVTYVGENSGDKLGFSVSAGGDINGDGIEDLLMAASFNDDNGFRSGKVYLIYGSSSLASITLDNADASFRGEANNDLAGSGLAGGADVNGDGLSDFLIGSPVNSEAFTESGIAYLMQTEGSVSCDRFDTLIDLSDTNLVDAYIRGQTNSDIFAFEHTNVGDINGDGYDDLAIGAYSFSPTVSGSLRNNAGSVFVFFGPLDSGEFDSSTADLIIHGEVADDLLGSKVASAGDVNGDGIADFLITAHDAQNTQGYETGAVYLVYGDSSWTDGGAHEFDLTDVTSSSTGGVKILAPESPWGSAYKVYWTEFGSGLSTAGDIDEDGYDDILIGYYNDSSLSTTSNAYRRGSVFVIFGGDLATAGTYDMADSHVYLKFYGHYNHDHSGTDVASGDFDGDGHPDILIGSKEGRISYSEKNYGHVSLIYWMGWRTGGSTTSLATYSPYYSTPATSIKEISLGNADARFKGEYYKSKTGYAVASAGDVDADGYDDILIGAYGAEFDSGSGTGSWGKAYLVYGSSTQHTGSTINDAQNRTEFLGDSSGSELKAGLDVSPAGDVDADDYPDILIGTFQSSYAGYGYLIYGADGLENTSVDLGTAADVTLQGLTKTGSTTYTYSRFTSGDFNGDGYSDVILSTSRDENNKLKGLVYHLEGACQ
jgi:hypothetical protein